MLARGPFARPAFRWLFAGSTITMLGSAMAPIALAFAVLDLGGSATDLGLVIAAYATADVLAALFGGVLGDRLPRRALMVSTALAAALVQVVSAASLIGGWASIPLLAGLGMFNGALGALGGPSSSAMTQSTVPASELSTAISARRIGTNIAMIIGSGLAGLVVAGAGSGWAIAADGLTFVLAAACFSRLDGAAPPIKEKSHVWADAVEGAREVFRHTWLWVLIGQAMLYHLFYGGSQGILGPIVVGDHIGRAAWGYALSAMMVGFVIGGLVTLRWRPRRALMVGTWFLALTACFPLAMALSDNLWIVLLGAALHGFGLEIFSVGWDLSIQEQVAPDKLARVYAFDLIGSFLARPLGLALTGPLAEAFGARVWLIVVAAVIGGSSVMATLTPDVRRLERLAPESVPA